MPRCPHCHNPHIPTWVKFWPVPTGSIDCPTCNRSVGVSPWVYGLAAALLLGILIASWYFPTGEVKWGIIAGALLLSLLVAWLAPLVRR